MTKRSTVPVVVPIALRAGSMHPRVQLERVTARDDEFRSASFRARAYSLGMELPRLSALFGRAPRYAFVGLRLM